MLKYMPFRNGPFLMKGISIVGKYTLMQIFLFFSLTFTLHYITLSLATKYLCTVVLLLFID